ncbi:MAG: MFS transporter [Chloroflexota bacterium]
MDASTVSPAPPTRNVDPYRLLYSLMIPAIIMPLAGWMFSVSLPTIRDDLQINAELAAWVATAFSLPFMILMPVYGRISDSLGKRRLLLFGIVIFTAGSIIAMVSSTLSVLLIGRVVQGLGIAGLLPISLALITEVFPSEERGKAMGRFSTIGPLTGIAGPLLAGFIVARWGWRLSFLPSALVAVASFGVIYFLIPSTSQPIRRDFFKAFDWGGVGLLGLTFTFLLFYFSSRPITGVPPLQDFRLLGLTVLFGTAFVFYEQWQKAPFINLRIFQNHSLVIASSCAALRMMVLSGGGGFLMPLYLADVVELDPTLSGFFLMVVPASMTLFVQLAGQFSDRFGSRYIVMAGFFTVGAVMLAFSRLTDETSRWIIIVLFAFFGMGAGFMLATLHRAALNHIPDEDLGTSSGVYSMIRFLGSASGQAFAGILIQFYLLRLNDALVPTYQSVFVWFAGFSLLGLITAVFLPATRE